MKKDIEINRLNINHDLKLNEEIHEKNNVINENKILNEKLDRIKGTYEEKYRSLEGIFTSFLK